MLFQGKERRNVVGYNVAEENMNRHQEGSTAVVVQGMMSGIVIETGQDVRKLRR